MIRLYAILILVFFCASLGTSAQTSESKVKLTAEIDGKAIKNEKLRVEVCLSEKKIIPQIIGNEFSLNLSDLTDDDRQGVLLRIFYKRYVVEFADLSKRHFQGEWRILLTTAPYLDKTNLPNAENADYAYMIEFTSENTHGTVRSNLKYRDQSFSVPCSNGS